MTTHKENHLRSLLKAVSWRVSGTAVTMSLTYYLTGEIEIAALVGGGEFLSKIVLFYMHERLWEKIPVGRGVRREA